MRKEKCNFTTIQSTAYPVKRTKNLCLFIYILMSLCMRLFIFKGTDFSLKNVFISTIVAEKWKEKTKKRRTFAVRKTRFLLKAKSFYNFTFISQ